MIAVAFFSGRARRSTTSARMVIVAAVAGVVGCMGCAGPPAARPAAASARTSAGSGREAVPVFARPDEGHLSQLRQLTFGGENAEAYWSADGTELVFQARAIDAGCDRIYRMSATAAVPTPMPVSSGAGATTCGFFLPRAVVAAGARTSELIFSSTQLAGSTCPPRPDRSHGYVWAIYPAYDIFRATADGQALRRLTATPGYDAEATVCPIDGSIVFTSVRDGDLDLYRMDADGKNVRRLTHELGYDGGAFFDRDCSHIVWRASRPAMGPEREAYQRLLGQGLVRPSKLELWGAEADGSNPMQITYLNAASFAPTFMPTVSPTPPRILFSSNYGDPQGREFDLWAIDVAGTNLERVTSAPGFDGFPMFTTDGQRLAFSSNRATAAGHHDTNVFVARWTDRPVRRFAETGADRILADIQYLADPARAGRGIGSAGLEAAAVHVEARLRELGLAPAGVQGSYRQPFQVPVRVSIGAGTRLTIAGTAIPAADFVPAAFSASGDVEGTLVLAGHGIQNRGAGVDDYAGVDARGKIVVVRRFAPEVAEVPGGPPAARAEIQRRAGDVRRKAFLAREHGAIALLVVDAPLPPAGASAATWKMPAEAALPTLRTDGYGDAGLPVIFVRRSAFAATLGSLEKRRSLAGALNVALSVQTATAANIVARVNAVRRDGQPAAGVVVVGAHYDHLGLGESHSLEPGSGKPHLGADDNASGTAALLEIARILMARRTELERDVVVVAFSGEEEGVLGSTAFTRAPPGGVVLSEIVAMINLDMVGRLRGNRVTVLGRGSAAEWPGLLESACATARIDCAGEAGSADGFGPSDQMPFYASSIPVAHFFTGSHPDYHRPSDSADKINAAGSGQIAIAAEALVEAVAAHRGPLTVRSPAVPPGGQGDMRSFGASLGTIPDYAGPVDGTPGVLLAGVRVGGAAERGGLRRGDILVRLGTHEIRSVEDLMYALGASHPGETADAVIERAGKTIATPVTFQGPPAAPAPTPGP